MSALVNFNGSFLNEEEVSISINNRSFRYGDGFFETIKVVNNKIILSDLHFSRLFSSLEALQFQTPQSINSTYFSNLVLELVERNNHAALARIRITFFRGDGGLYDEVDPHPNFIIQSWAGNKESLILNEKGLSIDIFQPVKKSCDNYSFIKSNNYLGYIMTALHAKKNNLDDSLVLNCYNRIADATIANLFIITNGVIKTPSLNEGCVSGVMRKYLITCLKKENMPIIEGEVSPEEILQASEVFLTNALFGIKWVEKVGTSNYTNSMSAFLHEKFITPLFTPATI